MMFFGLNRRVDWLAEEKVLEKPAVSIFRSEDADSTSLRNTGFYQPVHTAI
jgi:hypothetical protein